MKAKISKWGNDLALRLPRTLVEEAGLKDGQVVEVAMKDNAVELRKTSQIPRYRLEDLLAQIKPGTEPPPSVDWGPDVGAEILPEDEYSRGEITPDDLPKKRDV
jgi:antitoxin MazE